MRPRTTLTTAACALAAASLLLTACGGSGGGEKIAKDSGTPAPAPSAPTTTPAPTTSAPDSPAAPTFDFPPDVKVVIDADATGDPTKDAILRDQAYGEKAIFLAIAKLDTKLPVFQKYVVGKAGADWITDIAWGKSHHTSISGTTLFYNRKVTVTSPTAAGVTFCESQRNAFDKDTKTGKVARTTPSLDDFVLHTAAMRKAADGTWQMVDYRSQDRAKSCQR